MISTVGSTSTTAGASRSGAALSDQFDSFLQLLTTQLQNQDPLSPMDATQFTTQLVQFSTVEQAIKTNDRLETMAESYAASAQASALGYLGNTVDRDGGVALLGARGGTAFDYTLGEAAASVALTVRDADGEVVRTQSGGRAAGTNRFLWDGTDGSGTRLPAGVYTLEVAALDRGGNALGVTTVSSGTVDGVAYADGRVTLRMGELTLPLDAVRSVRTPAATEA